MHLSQSQTPICCLCASPGEGVSLTKITSENGRRENLEMLLDKYIVPILLLPKDDKLCLCDTCKTRLIEWDVFINSCKSTQERLRDSLTACHQTDLASSSKSQATNTAVSSVTEGSPPKRKKSSNYCIAPWCNKGNYQGVSLFRLPKDRERALSWLKEADRSDLNNMKTLRSYYLCANHFSPDMFTNSARNQLVRTAVPKLFPKAPYADKIAVKAAAAKIFPTQFQGVPLKSILPKVSSSNSASSNTCKKIAMKPVPVPVPKLKGVSTLNPTVLHLSSRTEETSSVSEVQTSSLIFEAQHQNDKFSIFSSTSTLTKDPYNSNTLYCVMKPSNSLISGSTVEPSLSHAQSSVEMSKGRPSNMGTKVQKPYLEEFESCFASDSFNPSPLMTSEVCQLPSHRQDDSYKAVAGSQDFLLPHALEDPSDGSTPSVSREPNPILNHNNELNPPHISIYDLPSDDIQGTEGSFINNMGNLDELMDLAKYFEGR